MDLQQYVHNNKLHVLVKPNAKKTEILGYDPERNAVKIAIAAPPEDNKANLELLRFLHRQLKKQVRLISGMKSKKKVLEIVQ